MLKKIKEKASEDIGGTIILSVVLILALLFFGFMLYLNYVMSTVPTSQFIDENPEPLAVGDIWTVDDQFSLWIDSVEEVSAETVKESYPYADTAIKDSEGKRYFDIVFSFENINFAGTKSGDTMQEYMTVSPWVDCKSEQGKITGIGIKTLDQEPPLYKYDYCTAMENGKEIFVTSGIISEDNHLFVEVDTEELAEQEETYGKFTSFEIRFCVPIEILSSEAAVQYAQNFYYPLPE